LLLLGSVDGIETDALSLLDNACRPGSGGNTLEKIAVERDTDTEK
jgi:hypothetical protein